MLREGALGNEFEPHSPLTRSNFFLNGNGGNAPLDHDRHPPAGLRQLTRGPLHSVKAADDQARDQRQLDFWVLLN